VNEANKEVAKVGAPVTQKRRLRHWTLACAAVLTLGLVVERSAAGNREDNCDIWFVHATDAHFFLKRVPIDEKAEHPKKDRLGHFTSSTPMDSTPRRSGKISNGCAPSNRRRAYCHWHSV
jgi:hypothetical protein